MGAHRAASLLGDFESKETGICDMFSTMEVNLAPFVARSPREAVPDMQGSVGVSTPETSVEPASGHAVDGRTLLATDFFSPSTSRPEPEALLAHTECTQRLMSLASAIMEMQPDHDALCLPTCYGALRELRFRRLLTDANASASQGGA